ncbi:MAG TPA: 30S ribosomal protein S6 [Solirubrobacteraceae bacterium]|jgi:small subunit ribosomal protein S6|nr:30S ribosomal protein S6 [Solirubrobacteraceae bacterium]
MTLPAPTYDLVVLLDTQAPDDARAKIVADTRAAIEGGGELVRYDAWGERPLTYPIERKSSAEYHLFQFHAGTAELLSGLNRTLRITDGILRFRVIKLKPGVPDAPDMGSAGRRSEPEQAEGEPHDAAEPTPVAAAPADAAAAPDAPADAAAAPGAATEAAEAAVGEPA